VKRSELKRTKGLKRSAPKARASISKEIRVKVLLRQAGRCVVTGCGNWPWHIHHALPRSKWPEFTLEPLNMVAICAEHHDLHERAHRRIRQDELPEATLTWIRTLGGRETLYLERTYR
jgi:hypothetical protein